MAAETSSSALPSSADHAAGAAAFIRAHREDADHNQYWYSAATVARILAAVEEPLEKPAAAAAAAAPAPPPRGAFLSTPSLFFALAPAARAAARHAVLDLDAAQFAGPGGEAFVRFDFRAAPPEAHLPAALLGAFDLVVIDPPFITEEVWRLYAAAARALLRADGPRRVVCTTVAENAALMAELFPGARRTRFQPSIPHLVYQYDLYCNWDAKAFSTPNPEVPE
jgi:hypothetical protein